MHLRWPEGSGMPAGDHRSTATCGSSSLRYRCRLGMGWPKTGAASCSAADGGRTASARSGFMGPIIRGTVESHVARLFKFALPMCRLGMGWPAARAASCSAADGGRTASARVRFHGPDHVPLHAIDHHRNTPSLEPILHRATKRICFCEMREGCCDDVSATRCA